jgi:Cu-processing system ATP-binding protein
MEWLLVRNNDNNDDSDFVPQLSVAARIGNKENLDPHLFSPLARGRNRGGKEAMIQIKNLRKSFGKLEILKGINLELNKGSITAIMGPNGSGKTTLLKCVLELVRPSSGNISVKGMSTKNNHEYRKLIGYMPQTPRYPENLKVKELIAMLKDVKGNHCDYDEELLVQLNMKEIYEKPIGTLSSGTKQRVSSAIAFLFDQEIIILDEPTAGLDPVSAEIVKNKIIKEKEKGKLIIITSHIISEVESLADRIIFLLEGNVYLDSTVEELKRNTGEENLNRAIAVLVQGGNSNGSKLSFPRKPACSRQAGI